MNQMKIDIRELVRFWGGATAMADLFEKHGYKPAKRNHLYKWIQRDSMPTFRWLEIEQIAIKLGHVGRMRKACLFTHIIHH